MIERRKLWGYVDGDSSKPVAAIRRYVTRPPLIDGAVYGKEMLERRVLPDRRKPISSVTT